MGRRLLGIAGDDATVISDMVARRLAETDGGSRYPQLPFHRVVTVCATILDPATSSVELRALGGDVFDERSQLAGFFRLITDELDQPRLISWNGNGFDLPVIRYRSMLHGVSAPGFYRTDGRWELDNYQKRHSDMHVDVMDVLSGYGASSRIGLGTLGKMLGLTGKSFIDGEVYEHILRGETERVVAYCKLDTLETLLIFLVWQFHRGAVSPDALRAWLRAAHTAAAAEPLDGWRDVAANLSSWPPWLR